MISGFNLIVVKMSTHLSNDRTAADTQHAAVYPSTQPSRASPTAQTESPSGQSSTPKSYPRPESKYEGIVQNPELFLEKLQGFNRSFGTKFKIPTIGGKALDLHCLFVEVTSRGGIEKVIRDRKWKEVITVFKFPSTLTSASFVLRKYYLSLLYHFEQVYYFQKEFPSISAADPVCGIVNGSATSHAFEDGASVHQFSASPSLGPGSSVSGTIDAKFDYGYLITVNLGSEQLKGVLYHIPMSLVTSQSSNSSTALPHQSRKKHQLALRDPSRPKPNRSGYNFFFAEHYGRLKPLYHGQEKAISKKIGLLWNRLSDAEKQVYQEKGLRDKERYRTEMREYRSSNYSQAQ